MDKCYEKFIPAKSVQVQQGFINNDFELVIIDGTPLYGISTGVFDKKRTPQAGFDTISDQKVTKSCQLWQK